MMRALIFTFVLAGCARELKPTLVPTVTIEPRDYSTVLDLWTRTDQAFTALDHRITVKATMITPMLRKAYSVRFPEVYGYGGKVTRDEMKDGGVGTEDTLNFFVAAYTPEFKWNDLHKPDSIWHVSLQRIVDKDTAALTVDAQSIEKVKIDENLRTIYPYLDHFDSGYIVRFPLTAGDGQLVLQDGVNKVRMRIASSFAAASMVWAIEP